MYGLSWQRGVCQRRQLPLSFSSESLRFHQRCMCHQRHLTGRKGVKQDMSVSTSLGKKHIFFFFFFFFFLCTIKPMLLQGLSGSVCESWQPLSLFMCFWIVAKPVLTPPFISHPQDRSRTVKMNYFCQCAIMWMNTERNRLCPNVSEKYNHHCFSNSLLLFEIKGNNTSKSNFVLYATKISHWSIFNTVRMMSPFNSM